VSPSQITQHVAKALAADIGPHPSRTADRAQMLHLLEMRQRDIARGLVPPPMPRRMRGRAHRMATAMITPALIATLAVASVIG
jgi:hypothetical protein